MNNTSSLYNDLKNPQLALEYNEKARVVAESIGAQDILSALAFIRGSVYSNQGKFEEAKAAFNDGLLIFRKAKTRWTNGVDRYGALPDANIDVSGIFTVYVEDDISVRTTTETLLREFGISYDTSKSVAELRTKLPSMERMPDLILTDNGLPDGGYAIDVINEIEGEFGCAIPTIVLTGDSRSNDSLQRLKSATILRKPVSAIDLLKTIQAPCEVDAQKAEAAITPDNKAILRFW